MATRWTFPPLALKPDELSYPFILYFGQFINRADAIPFFVSRIQTSQNSTREFTAGETKRDFLVFDFLANFNLACSRGLGLETVIRLATT